MVIIPVPPPSPSAFNKNRPPSDLLQSQLSYFQHLEQRHSHKVPSAVAQAVTTEDGAARYIAHMTRLIREKALAAKRGTTPSGKPSLKLVDKPKTASAPIVAIAAAAAKTTKSKSAKPKPPAKPTKRRKP